MWAMSCDQVHKVSLVVKEYVTSAGQQRGRMSEKRKAQVFPFVDIALRLFMTLPVTNASRGRSLLKIGASYRKTEIHNGPKQTESPVSDLSINSDILGKLDFTSLLKEFSVGRSVPRNTWSQQLWGTHTCFSIISVLVKAVSMCVYASAPRVCA